MSKRVRVKAPASISNLNCGFDVLGMAMNRPFDVVDLELTETGIVEITEIKGCPSLSRDPDKNVVGVVLKAVMNKTDGKIGFRAKLEKGISPGSGIGSSAASSAAAACAANLLLGGRFSMTEVVSFAMEGERLASGSAHADNVAPSVLGGITLVRSYEPLDIVRINIPSELFCVVIHPAFEVKTSEARKVLDSHVPLNIAVKQWGNVGGLIAGLYTEDYDLISHSLVDYVAEPRRASLIPHFYSIRSAAVSAGALGAGISGSGPSTFALCRGEESAHKVCNAMSAVMKNAGVAFDPYITQVSRTGASECF